MELLGIKSSSIICKQVEFAQKNNLVGLGADCPSVLTWVIIDVIYNFCRSHFAGSGTKGKFVKTDKKVKVKYSMTRSLTLENLLPQKCVFNYQLLAVIY